MTGAAFQSRAVQDCGPREPHPCLRATHRQARRDQSASTMVDPDTLEQSLGRFVAEWGMYPQGFLVVDVRPLEEYRCGSVQAEQLSTPMALPSFQAFLKTAVQREAE